MNRFLLVGVLVVIIILGGLLLQSRFGNQQVEQNQSDALPQKTYSNESLGLAFDYEKGDDGYTLLERTDMSTDPTFLVGMVIIDTNELNELRNSTEPREGPPVIQVRVYHNTENQWATQWVDTKPTESNIQLALAEPSEVVVGGANGVSYTVDGLYQTDVYVVATHGFIFVFEGSSSGVDAAIRADFARLIESVEFIRTPNQN